MKPRGWSYQVAAGIYESVKHVGQQIFVVSRSLEIGGLKDIMALWVILLHN